MTATEARDLSTGSIDENMKLIEDLITRTAMKSGTHIHINSENVTDLIRDRLSDLGYTIGPVNNGMVCISWLQ